MLVDGINWIDRMGLKFKAPDQSFCCPENKKFWGREANVHGFQFRPFFKAELVKNLRDNHQKFFLSDL